MSRKTSILLLFLFVGLIYILIGPQLRLGWGYKLNVVGDGSYLTRHDEIIVDEKIIDNQVVSGYMIGLKLPMGYLACNQNRMRIILDVPTYFIVELEPTLVKSYKSRDEFNEKVRELSLRPPRSMRYDLFDKIFKFGYRLDTDESYEKCLEIHGLGDLRIVRELI